MKRYLFLSFVLLVLVAVGAPCALADQIVDITVPSTTFIGNPIFPCLVPCTETVSASFEYDNTTATTILASVDINAMGALAGGFFFDFSSPGGNQVVFFFLNGVEDIFTFDIPATSTGAILPGGYTTNLLLSSDFPPFKDVNAIALVTVTPEPPTWMLVLGATLLTLVMKWKTLRSTPRAPRL